MNQTKPRHQDIWWLRIRGINVKIVKWQFNLSSSLRNKDNWNYYLLLKKENFSPEDWKKVQRRGRKWSYGILGDDIYWHGKCTYRENDIDGPKTITVGCDFQHSWDDEHGEYYLEGVISEATRTVDELHAAFSLKLWSNISGKYFLEKDGKYNDYGNFKGASE